MPEIFTGTVETPGLYPDVPEDAYHRDPVPEGSLSVSGMKKLLPPGCPAIYDYDRKHPHRASKAMDLGTTVHGLVLGTGADIAVLDFADRRTKAYKEAEAEAIAAGKVPMLAKDYAEAAAIAIAVHSRPNAAALFSDGDAEVSMFWQDEYCWHRGRMDWLTYIGETPTIVDFKTAADASPDARSKSAGDFGYFMQDPHYRQGLAACLKCDPQEIDFVFVVVQTEPPYLVQEHRLLPRDLEVGAELCRQASEIYAGCTEAGVWPAWSDEIDDLPLTGYQRVRAERIINDFHGITPLY
jgi:hypothetical protein